MRKGIDLESINITNQKLLTLFDVTSFQLNGMICISKTVDFSTAADHTETTTV